MSDVISSAEDGTPYVPQNDQDSINRKRLKEAILSSRNMMPRAAILASAPVPAAHPSWYLKARKIDRDELKDLLGRRWLLQGQLDELIDKLQQDIKAFAEPLLIKALKDKLQVTLDVRTAELHVYVPSQLIFGIDSGASHSRQVSLLNAALHNFDPDEAKPKAFSEGSGVFTLDDEGAPLRHALSVEKFVTLCRELDLGAQYQAHLKEILTPAAATARNELQQRSVASDKATFKLAALTAYLKGDITFHAFGQLLAVHDGTPERLLYGAPMLNHRLSLMGFRLTGITLFSAVGEPSWAKKAVDTMTAPALKAVLDTAKQVPILPDQDFERFKLLKAFFANGPKGLSEDLVRRQDQYKQSRVVGRMLVYIPDDPDHPLKEYDSFTGFMQTLTGQLARPDYQQFFSRFVAQKDHGVFFHG